MNMTPLNDEQRELVGRAWRIGMAVARRHARSCRGPEYDGFVAERLVAGIRRYDPSRGLAAWAASLAWGACLDAKRYHAPLGIGRRAAARPAVEGEPAAEAEGFPEAFARRDPAPEWEERESFDAILAPLDGRARGVLTGLYRDGLKQCEVAAATGLSISWVCRIHADALAALRRAMPTRRSVT
jgi:RNA polymerase sigma factor (sigma-70 family)